MLAPGDMEQCCQCHSCFVGEQLARQGQCLPPKLLPHKHQEHHPCPGFQVEGSDSCAASSCVLLPCCSSAHPTEMRRLPTPICFFCLSHAAVNTQNPRKHQSTGKRVTSVSGWTAVGQQEYWRILLTFQVRKGRVRAATAKPAETRAVISHKDVLPGSNRSSRTSQRDCKYKLLNAVSLHPLWLLFPPTLMRSFAGTLQGQIHMPG